MLQPKIDPTFSRHSYGFRPGRSAHQAVKAAKAYVQSGRRVVFDVDLEKFFDRINHSTLIDRLRKRIDDAAVIGLIRAYLNSGIMQGGIVQSRERGRPQGGPLSPLLANVLLDEVDKDPQRRAHCFAHYADDCNVYVRRHKLGERVMALLRSLYARLHLTDNETNSAAARVIGRKFLGTACGSPRAGGSNFGRPTNPCKHLSSSSGNSRVARVYAAWQKWCGACVRTCLDGRLTLGCRKHRESRARWTNGYDTDCGPFNSSIGSAGKPSSVSCVHWVPAWMLPPKWPESQTVVAQQRLVS